MKKYAHIKEQRQHAPKKSFDARHTYGQWYVALQTNKNVKGENASATHSHAPSSSNFDKQQSNEAGPE